MMIIKNKFLKKEKYNNESDNIVKKQKITNKDFKKLFNF